MIQITTNIYSSTKVMLNVEKKIHQIYQVLTLFRVQTNTLLQRNRLDEVSYKFQNQKHTKFRVSNFKNAVSDNFRINMIRKLFLHYLRIKLIRNKEKV